MVHVANVVGLGIARPTAGSRIKIGQPFIGPGTVICTPGQKLVDHAVDGRPGQRKDPVLNGLGETANDRVYRGRPRAAIDGQIIGVPRLKHRRGIGGVQTDNIEHLGALVDLIVGERIIYRDPVRGHPACG